MSHRSSIRFCYLKWLRAVVFAPYHVIVASANSRSIHVYLDQSRLLLSWWFQSSNILVPLYEVFHLMRFIWCSSTEEHVLLLHWSFWARISCRWFIGFFWWMLEVSECFQYITNKLTTVSPREIFAIFQTVYKFNPS